MKRWIDDRLFEWLLRSLLPRYFAGGEAGQYFRRAERAGYHVTLNTYYSPIPDTGQLPEQLWDTEAQLPGIDMNDPTQLELLQEVLPRYQAEFDGFPLAPGADPYQYHHQNFTFVGLDAIALYCLSRHFRPTLIVEVGSGFSTRLSAQALRSNGRGELICIEPYPDAVLRAHPGITQLIPSPVQAVERSLFERLGANDILFIDSTHTVKIGSDVNLLVLEVLPRLQPGVIVHFHDIFLPRDYPRPWILEARMFSNEQYLLQAFLNGNAQFEVLFSSAYLTLRHRAAVESRFGRYPRWNEGCSLWLRRKS